MSKLQILEVQKIRGSLQTPQLVNGQAKIDLSVRTKSIKISHENIGVNLRDLRLVKAFLDTTLNTHATKEILNCT